MDRDEYERTDPAHRDRSTGRGGTGRKDATRRKDYSAELERFFVEGDHDRGFRVHRIVSCTKRKITGECSYTIHLEEDAVAYAGILSAAFDVTRENVRVLGSVESAGPVVIHYLELRFVEWGLQYPWVASFAQHTGALLLMTVCLDLNLPIPKSLREVLVESLGFFYGR